MGIKHRGGRAYFYESVRQGDRVLSRYVGRGDLAIACAMNDRRRREEAAAEREAREAQRKRVADEDARVAELYDRIEAVARRVLEAAGYRQHDRGAWRKRRMAKRGSKVVIPRDADGRVEILSRAQKGDESALPQLRAMFDDPSMELARHFGDLAGACDQALLRVASGKNLAFRVGLERRLRDLRDELAGPRPTAIERLLAERAATCWLALHGYELREALAKDMTLSQAEYQRRRIDSAHRRYLSALKTLATVRKLALPALQVNVAENQVVVGGA